ncbi:hemerythrin domain-containing protein [Salibacterium aidingense]|uniref:hemerythrin domain-containing protein n=1 Tax=Salibacterium aidingense TaxID=384933 RepID=UPI000407329A|nr:hemerythrin domain-containing protein [Salibacterium aidingense]
MKPKRESIKRHEALYPLSHHHHQALFVALNLKRAGTELSRYSVTEVLEDTLSFWEPAGKQHFREEEEILLTAFARYDSVDHPEIKDMLMEHVQIRALIDSISQASNPPVETLQKLGILLENHVRKEERVIFPMIERVLPEEKLQELSAYFTKNE